MSDGLRLAESLSERLCHDLAGLVGTVTALLELAADPHEDVAGERAEVIAAAREASIALTARLRLLRTAWGSLGTPLDAQGLGALLRGLPGAERLAVDLGGLTETLSPPVARVVLNLLLVAAQSLPAGGQISVRGSDGGGLVVMIAGRTGSWPGGFAACVADPMLAQTAMLDAPPSGLLPPLAVLLAREAGMRLSWLMAPGASDAPLPLLLQHPAA